VIKVVGHQSLLWICLVAGVPGSPDGVSPDSFPTRPWGQLLILALIASFEDSRSLNGLIDKMMDRSGTDSRLPNFLPPGMNASSDFETGNAVRETAALRMDPRSMIAVLFARILKHLLATLSAVAAAKFGCEKVCLDTVTRP